MRIKDRLALYFTLASTLTLLIVLSGTYFTFSKFLESDFFDRLTDRTMVTANLYLEADEMSETALQKNRDQYLERLNSEIIRIYDANNEPVFIDANTSSWSHEVIESIRKQGKLKFKDGKNQVVGIFYKDNQGDFVIIASALDQSTFYRLDKLRTVMFFIFMAIFVGLLLSARWIANRILKPLDLFIDEVKQIRSDNMNFRVQEGSSKDEISQLAASFNKLMEHLEQAFVLQRTFIANASHELRTPVTSMIIGAEIVLSKDRASDDYKKALSSVLEDADRMDRIITGLLGLAQSDLEYGAAKLEDVSLNALLHSIADDWRMSNTKASLTLSIMPDENADYKLLSNPTLLAIAINNIIANGFKFSNDGDVSCLLDVGKGGAVIRIADMGPGIPVEDQPFIFEPFYRSVSGNKQEGTGMGLYMAQKIVNLFKGTVVLKSSGVGGTVFEIHFPAF
jgi:signal transduction histidine kinase